MARSVGSVVIRNWGMAAIVVAALPVSPVRAQQLLWTQDRPTTIDHYGSSVAFIRDWNGDGVADVVIGAYESTCAQPGDGDVEVRDGVAGVPLLLRWCGDQDASGATVVPVADVDGDGREDLVSAGPLFDDPTGGRDQGRIVLVSSATGAALWELIGESDLDNLGSVLALIIRNP